MHNPQSKPPGKRRGIDWLAIDSAIDSGLYRAGSWFKDGWSAYSTFFGKFRLRGPLRIANEFTSEALTLGVGGMAVMIAFAIPAFEEAGDIKAEPYAVTFLDRYGNEIGKRGSLHDDAVPLEEIPDVMIKATLGTEDRRFFEHFGIDVMGTFRAMTENIKADGVVQGGSSLTQQLAKNLFLSSERTLDRKIKEAFLAMWLEMRYTKKEILKMYLDKAYMGGGAIGVEGAAQFYFGKSVRDVNLAEAAMMAGLFKAPARYAPHINLPAARARANEVLENMVQAGYLTEGQVFGARMNPAQVIERPDFYSPEWFLDWAFEETQRIMRKSGKPDVVLIARTTVDVGLQRAADQAVDSVLRTTRRSRRTQRRRSSRWRRTARCAPWSAAATTARASSIARRTPSASPAPRSSPTSICRR
jgi:penicillin-binding protein 1A